MGTPLMGLDPTDVDSVDDLGVFSLLPVVDGLVPYTDAEDSAADDGVPLPPAPPPWAAAVVVAVVAVVTPDRGDEPRAPSAGD